MATQSAHSTTVASNRCQQAEDHDFNISRQPSNDLVEVERLSINSTKPLLWELHLWRLTRGLQRLFFQLGDGPMQSSRARDQLEARNILDRWLLSFQLDYKGRMRASLPILPQSLRLADAINQKLVDECLEKRFSATRGNAERIAQALIDSVDDFEADVLRRVEQEGSSAAVVVFLERRLSNGQPTEGQLLIGHQYKSPCCPRIWFLTRNYGTYNTARMLLRYETLGTGSLQWGDPVTVHHALYNLMGVRFEGFASPLNSKLLGKPGAAFCSLFRDTDAPFGSLGEFFSVNFDDHPGGWTVNPPFIEELMIRVADKVLLYLDRQTGSNWFFITFPKWEDCPAWRKLAESRHLRHLLNLPPSRFTVQDCYGSVLIPRMSLSIFALGELPDGWRAVEQCFLNSDAESVEAVWLQHCMQSGKHGKRL